MRKRTIIALIMAIFLCGCTGSNTTKTKEPIHFLFATPLSTHTLWLQAKDGMEDACEHLEIVCDWKGPTNINTIEMEDVIYTGILQKTNGIITQGVIDPSLIEQAKQAQIPFVLVDSGIQGSIPQATITKDFTQQAELLLADIEETLGKDKKLKIGIQVSQLSFDLAQGQIEAVKEVFQRHAGGFEILAITESKSDKLHAREQWQNVINEKINVALNFAGEGASGCVEAIEALGQDSDLLIYGVDDMNDTLTYIQAGKIKGSIVTSFYQYGYDAVYLLYEAFLQQEQSADQNIAAKLIMLNQRNLATYQEALSE